MLMLKLGLAGTAKNTGKTTAAFAIMEELRVRRIPFYLTSIGYDGENLDNITGLPKPKLKVAAGDVVATAQKALTAGTAKYQILYKTGIKTPLGEIYIVKITQEGLVVTAGPNKSSEVRQISQLLHRLGPGVILFDGALSRIAPMTEADGLILATGAAKTPDIVQVALETEKIAYISQLPKVPYAAAVMQQKIKTIAMLDAKGYAVKTWPQNSLLRARDAEIILQNKSDHYRYLYIPGIIGKDALRMLSDILCTACQPKILAFADPIKLLAANDAIHYQAMIQQMSDQGIFVGVLRRIPLLAVTVNPFYPEYRLNSKTYAPAYVDFVRLRVAVQKRLNIPVYNVIEQGSKGLVDIILANAGQWESPEAVYFDF